MATGVLTIGNSGVGKSLLDNIILGREAFVHDMCPGSVTSRTEEAIVNTGVPEWGAVKVFNIPGLIEADPAKIARNKTELNRAFESCDQQVIVYVFGNEGGRVRAEDLQAFVSIKNAYEINPASMLFVFNKTPGRFTQERKNEAMAIIRSEIRNVLGSDIYDKVPFVFVKNFGDDDFGPNPYTRPDFKEAQADLHKSIFNRVRHGHRKVKEIELNPNREMLNSLKEQIAQMTKDMAENQRKYNDQLLQIQRENERAMREANENFQRAMAARPPEVHHHHHSSGPSCVIC